MRKSLIILSVFFGCGFIAGIYFVGTPTFIVPDTTELKKGLDSEAEIILPLSVSEMRFKKRPQEWLRNPFAPPREVGFSGDIVIEAILISPAERRVMIAGETYCENDILGVYRIKKIFDDYIVVTEGTKDQVIKLKKGD